MNMTKKDKQIENRMKKCVIKAQQIIHGEIVYFADARCVILLANSLYRKGYGKR